MITKKQVARHLRKLAREEPERSNAGCTYKHPDGTPNCVVGQLIHDLDPILFADFGRKNFPFGCAPSFLHRRIQSAFTPKAIELLVSAQAVADRPATFPRPRRHGATYAPWRVVADSVTTSSD